MFSTRKRFTSVIAAACIGACVLAAQSASAGVLYWDADGNATGAVGGSGNWDTASNTWRIGSTVGALTNWTNAGGDNDAYLPGTASGLTTTTAIFVNDITVDPGLGSSILGASKLTLVGSPTIDIAGGGNSLFISTPLGGTGFTKAGAGTLVLDNVQGTGSVFGNISVTSGTLQAGTTNAVAGYNTASQALRANAINLAGGTSLNSGNASGVGAFSDLRFGSLSGSGTVAPGGATSGIVMTALINATSSATISSPGGLQLRGGNGTTQSLTGNGVGIAGSLIIQNGATLLLSGTGDSTSGVLGSTSVQLRGGILVLDNTAGNTGAAAGRLLDTATLNSVGTFSLIGNSAGTLETVGTFSMQNGALTILVTNNGGTGAELKISDTGGLRDATSGTINFVGAGTGTLGSAGNNPRVTFTGAINTNTTNGMLANTSGAAVLTTGWARVNSNFWAGVGANGIVALADTGRTSADINSAGATELTNLVGSGTLSGNKTVAAIKFSPSGGGQSLGLSTLNLVTGSVMLAGTTDFSITGTGAINNSTNTRYFYVNEADTTLTVSANLAAAGAPLNKAGAGILALNGTGNQMSGTALINYNLLEGVLRGSLTNMGGGTAAGGAFTTINLYGGGLEISGGGSLTRALGLAGTTSGGGLKWDGGSGSRDGGFSAIGGNASVNLVTLIGGTIAATPVWNVTAGFITNGSVLIMGSTKADSTIDFQNSIGLDDGTVTNAYNAREVRVIDNTGSATDIARLSGVISGSANADLLKTGAGVLELSSTGNSYTGNTLIREGKLKLTTTTSSNIGTSANIVVGLATGSSAVLDVTSVTNATGFEVLSGQTLSGHGKILSTALQTKINAGATIAPGTSIGTLTIDGGSFTLAGDAALEITGNAAANTYDKIVAINNPNITYGGSLTVSFLTTAPTLAGIYTLFSGFNGTAGSFAGGIYLPTAPVGLQWHNYSGSLFDYVNGQIQLEAIVASNDVTVTPGSGNLGPAAPAVVITISGGSANLGAFSTSGLGWSTNGLTAGSFNSTQNLNTVSNQSGRLNGTFRGRTSFTVSGATGTGNGIYSYTLSDTASLQSATPGIGIAFGAAQSSTLLSGDKYTGQNTVEGAGGLGRLATLVDSTAIGGDSNVSMSWRNRSVFEAYPGTTPPLPTNISSLITDVVKVDLGASVPSAYVMQMSYDPANLGAGQTESDSFAANHLYLAHMTPEFFNAVDTGDGQLEDRWQNASLDSGSPQLGVLRGYLTSDLATIGSWGVDSINHVAWAVLPGSLQGQFAVVPEPASLSLLALGALGLLRRRR